MAFKLKSALKFGQKGTYKQKTYNSPNKQKTEKQKLEEYFSQRIPSDDYVHPMEKRSKEKMDGMLKEWLMTNRGFNQEDADRMIADGAYTHKDMFKDVPAEGKSPNKQEGPIPKKNIKLQPGEMEGTYLFGHNYGDEDIPGRGEGFEPTGTKDQKFTANERINDLEERASFLIENDIPDLEGSTDPKDIKRLKTLKATVKKLHGEADIMRKRRENMRKSSPNKQKETQDTWEPAYEGGDHSWKDLQAMSDKEIMKSFPDAGKNIIKDLHKKGYRKKKGEAGPIKQKEGNPDVLNPDLPEDVKRRIGDKPSPSKHMEDDDSFPHEHGPDDGIIFPKGKKSPAKHHTNKKPVKKVPRKKVQRMPISEEGREIDSTNAEKARGEVYSWDPRQTKRLTEKEDKQAFIKESTPSSMKRKKYK